ncbi:MAG TPA: hypothetical protein VH352_22845, partial [Pseudonocardiaceae bacterium]|nr:hypothetical protein [Pseudonocardiaceae bacterium]
EAFTLCRDGVERGHFIAAVLAAAGAANSRTRVVLGVRADFYGNCAEYPDLVDALRDGQTLVGPMQADELRSAITRPAAAAGLVVESVLVATIVAEMLGRPGALPLMSHALVETWRRRRGTTVSLAGYRAAGGIDGAVAQTAEHTYRELDPEQQNAARDIMLRLTALGENTEDTRRRVPTSELRYDDPATTRTIDKFVRARLLTLGEHTIEIAHEALIHAWPRLRTWLTEDRDGIALHHRLTDATRTWENLGRDPGALYRGLQLAAARTWYFQRCTTRLTPSERDFLDASIAARTQEQRTRRRGAHLLWGLTGAVVVLAVVATVASLTRQQDQTPRAGQGSSPSSQSPVIGGQPQTLDVIFDARAAKLTRQLAAVRSTLLPPSLSVEPVPLSSDRLAGKPVPPLRFVTTREPSGNTYAFDGAILDTPRTYDARAQLRNGKDTNIFVITVGRLKAGTSIPDCQRVGSGYMEYNCTVRTLPDGTRVKTFNAASGGAPGTTDIGRIRGTFMEAARPDGTFVFAEDDVADAAQVVDTGPPPMLSSQALAAFATVFTW